MKTVTISITYSVKFRISNTHLLTTCGRVIDIKKGVECKKFLRGSKEAVYINGAPVFIDELKECAEIPYCPF